eukprot:scaffold1442_cov128-Cylindrotheca_fusiformis.AAC.43
MTLPKVNKASHVTSYKALKVGILLIIGIEFLNLAVKYDSLQFSSFLDTTQPLSQPSPPRNSADRVISIRSGASKDPTTASRIDMPAIGYGTCCRPTAKGEPLYESTKYFLEIGGKLIDTAVMYDNHKEIGRAIRDVVKNRSDIWITSKITDRRVKKGRQSTVEAVKKILNELQTPYLDLCLIHFPTKGKEKTIEIWKGLIDAVDSGLVRAIGVSNMNRLEILDLQEATGVMPAVNQIQYHPWTPKQWKDLVRWHMEHDIATTAYTSLGGSRFSNKSQGDGRGNVGGGGADYQLVLTELAQKYDATTNQVLLQWALGQTNVAVIPGSSNREHILENLNLPNFSLSAEERERLENAGPPQGWWDPQKGPVKMLADEATKAWVGDHVVS